MLIIILSWCYTLITLINFGVLAKSVFKVKIINKLMVLVLGLISLLIIGHIWAFFRGFTIIYHLLLLTSNAIISWEFQKEITLFIINIKNKILAFSTKNKILLIIIFLFILTKSASQGSILDNENYYIQTIKWLSEFGFVNGLANLHLFFGQTSGWHILQSMFSFEFLNFPLNDLGSLLLLILNVYALNFFQQKKSKNLLLALPIFNFFLLEFTIVPSADFGIIFFALISFYIFLKSYKTPTSTDFYLVFLCVLSAFLIKVTAIGLIIMPLVLLFKLKKLSLRIWFRAFSLGAFFSLLLISKNLIISGYPFFPSEFMSGYINLDHKIPEELYNFSLRSEKLYEFFANIEQVRNLTDFELFWEWLTRSKVSMIFNTLLLFSILIIPLTFFRYKLKTKYWWIYISFLCQLSFLAMTSPQYRFAIHYLTFFMLLFFNIFLRQQTMRYIILGGSQLLVLYFLIFPIRFDNLSSHKFQLNTSGFKIKNIFTPAPNSSIQAKYKINKIGNLKYYTPVEKIYLWSNGDCDLPCVNNLQLKYILHRIQVYPQLKDSTKIERGFYSKKM